MIAEPKTERPKRSAEKIIAAAAQALAVEVQRWDGQPADLADIERVLRMAMRYAETDGYQIARRMERTGFAPDQELVEILSNAGSAIHQAHQAACIEWVKYETARGNMKCPALESKVRVPSYKSAGVGTVIKNHLDGTSTICFPALGHVREGSPEYEKRDRERASIMLGQCFAWERLELAEDEKEQP